jgi:hypothetical protein
LRRAVDRVARSLAPIGVLVLASTATAALANGPSIGFPPTLKIDADAGIVPKALPATGVRAPVSLHFRVRSSSSAEGQPPRLREITLDLDRQAVIDAEGMPSCHIGHPDEPPIAERCESARIGSGAARIEVDFPEQSPIIEKSKLQVFNAGFKSGKPAVLLYGELRDISLAFAIKGVISRTSRGVYGTSLAMTIPKIAGGYGSMTSVSLKLHRRYLRSGKRKSYVLARCSKGHLALRADLDFVDGTALRANFIRPCEQQFARS